MGIPTARRQTPAPRNTTTRRSFSSSRCAIFFLVAAIVGVQVYYHTQVFQGGIGGTECQQQALSPQTFDRPHSFSSSDQHASLKKTSTTPTIYNNHFLPKENHPFRVIHTLSTRFMVGQPGLPLLTRARLKLFEVFCLPTILGQTNQNFYWLLLVEAQLENSVLKELESMVKHMPNAFMVLTSNTTWVTDGAGVQKSQGYGITLQEIADLYRRGSIEIISGDLEHLSAFDYRTMSDEDQIVLRMDTLVDADDGLHHQAVEKMQSMAVNWARHQQSITNITRFNLENSWWNFCGSDHLEWHNRETYLLTEETYQERGISSGLVGLRKRPHFCTSVGTTRVGCISLPITELPKFPMAAERNHAVVLSDNPTCEEGTQVAFCSRRVFPDFPLVFRSRVSARST